MIRAYLLSTGPDGHSHILRGRVNPELFIGTSSLHFKESATFFSLDWHSDPLPQYVITLSGAVEIVTRTGENCILRPGNILIAMDSAGSGHQWRLTSADPWIRACVVFTKKSNIQFIPDETTNERTAN